MQTNKWTQIQHKMFIKIQYNLHLSQSAAAYTNALLDIKGIY